MINGMFNSTKLPNFNCENQLLIRSRILILVIIFFFLQGCSVYRPIPVSVEAAAKSSGKVKVQNNAGQTFKFDKIEKIGLKYFGIKGNNELLISQSDLSVIYLIDTKKSRRRTILTAAGIAVGTYGVLA